MLNFIFSGKGLGLVSPPHFVHNFSRKMFLMLDSINWPNFIVWLPILLEILDNMFNFAQIYAQFWLFRNGCGNNFSRQKVKTTIQLTREGKELLKWNKKHFLSFLISFQLPKVISDLRVCLLRFEKFEICSLVVNLSLKKVWKGKTRVTSSNPQVTSSNPFQTQFKMSSNELVTRRFELVTRRFELLTRVFELITRGFEAVTREFEFAPLNFNSCF